MRFLLRPICWRKGHAPWITQYVEALPLPFLVCSRCHKLANDEAQLEFYRREIDLMAAGS